MTSRYFTNRPSVSLLKVLALLTLTVPALALAGLFTDEEAQKNIAEVNSRLNTLGSKLSARIDTKADKSEATELLNQNQQLILQNQQLLTDVSKLRDTVDLLSKELAKLQLHQRDFYLDLDARLREFEPKKVTVDGKEGIAELGEQRAYDVAIGLFKGDNYKASAIAFNSFIGQHPLSIYAGSASYWLGNSYFAQHDCKSTIASFQSMITTFPDHAKVPLAMLNIAACHIELKDKVAARKVLQNVIAHYPDSEAAQTAKTSLTLIR